MKLSLFCLVALAASCHARFIFQQEWSSWKEYHGKSYLSDTEEANRQAIWQDNFLYVTKHNYEAAMGEHTFTLDMNYFADLETEEWRAIVLGKNPREQGDSFCDSVYVHDPEDHVQVKTVDWSKKGYVTAIKDQKQCGSCWAFSTTGSLEGQHFAKTGKLVSMSEQNLVDCSKPEGNEGCNGGLMDLGFEYISKHGIDSEESYPYTAKDGKCMYSKKNVVANLTGCVDIETGSEKALMDAVGKIGPVSVGIDASHRSFQLYSEGVYYEKECSTERLDHGVLAVGYGTETAEAEHGDYWLVKNSWGKTWGMEGYIHMSRGRNNNCGIASQASYPVV